MGQMSFLNIQWLLDDKVCVHLLELSSRERGGELIDVAVGIELNVATILSQNSIVRTADVVLNGATHVGELNAHIVCDCSQVPDGVMVC